MLSASQITTKTGQGQCGKQRLALRYADIYPTEPLLNSDAKERPSAAGLMSVRYFQAEPDHMIELALSQWVPYRMFTLDAPRRLVLDFRAVDRSGLAADRFAAARVVTDVRFGTYRPGRSRMAVDRAGLSVDPETAEARLTVRLAAVSDTAYAEQSGPPNDPR